MEFLIVVLGIIPSILSVCVSGIYAYIALKKQKEPPKDEIWETATKIFCSNDSFRDADDFAFLYEQLKFFKENGCSMKDINSLTYAVRQKQEQEQQ